MSKEEKAKEYSNKICAKYCRSKCEVCNICTIYKERIKNYLAGYTQAEQDLSSQLTACKEVLREIADKVNMLTYSIVEEEININDHFFAETMDVLAQAEQLLTDNTK